MKSELMNKWCKAISEKSPYYIKVTHVKHLGYNQLHGECINDGKYVECDYWANTNMENSLVEVPISQVEPYLPYKINKQFKIFI